MKNRQKRYKKRRRKNQRDFQSHSYRTFRRLVSLRDNRECLVCKYVDGKKSRGRTNIHHIKKWQLYEELRYWPPNGCVLCFRHHSLISQNEFVWITLLETLVKKSEVDYIEKYGMSPYEDKESTE